MTKKKYLFTPGPTPIPDEVNLEMAQPLIHHRTDEFRQYYRSASDKLKKVFQTQENVYILSSSGTGSMESAVVNFLSPGDQILVVCAGKFSERFSEIANGYDVIVHRVDIPWGQTVQVEQIKKLFEELPQVKALYVPLCETSTGVKFPIQELGKITHELDKLLVVDAISGLTADKLKMDEWFVDVVISGSQKGFMLPPGLSFIATSQKAQTAMKRSQLPKFYFDLKKYEKALLKDNPPFSPATTLIRGLDRALDVILEHKMEDIWKRHELFADAVRQSFEAINLELFADSPSSVLTAVKIPEQLDCKELISILRERFGVTVAGGQGELAGRIFRFSHLGYHDALSVLSGIGAVENALALLDHEFDIGAGVKTFQRLINQNSHSLFKI